MPLILSIVPDRQLFQHVDLKRRSEERAALFLILQCVSIRPVWGVHYYCALDYNMVGQAIKPVMRCFIVALTICVAVCIVCSMLLVEVFVYTKLVSDLLHRNPISVICT